MNVEKVLMRCVECGDCRLWTGPLDTEGAPIFRITGSRKLLSVRRYLAEQLGMDINGKFASNLCERKTCVEPEHIRMMTRKQLQVRTGKQGKLSSKTKSAKISAAIAHRRKLTDEAVQDIRTTGISTRAAAAKYGICQSVAWHVQAGLTYKDHSNPFAGLM